MFAKLFNKIRFAAEFVYYLLRHDVLVREHYEPLFFDHGSGEVEVMNVPAYEVKPTRIGYYLRTLALLVLLVVLLLLVFSATAHGAGHMSICNHHVTSGVYRELIDRGMARAFFFGQAPTGMWIGYLIVWDPNCQRAILGVYRAKNDVWNFVTHYYIDGAKGQSVKAAIKYARARLAQDVVKVIAGGKMVPRAIPRGIGAPGFRPPKPDGIRGGGKGGGMGGALGGGLNPWNMD